MTNPLHDLTAALRRLGLSTNQQAVYLSLLQEGTATARTIASRTTITRPSVYDQLKALRVHGLVVELEKEGKTHFATTDIRQLDLLLADKIERIQRSRASLSTSLPTLLETFESVQPKIRFFEGSQEVKNILKDVLWNTPKSLTISWPSASMGGVFDAAYLSWFAERLAAQKVSLTLTAEKGHPFTGCILKKFSTLKSKSSMATIRYGNRVAHISSPKEAYGFIVESAEYAFSV